jgi:hypothetical protein
MRHESIPFSPRERGHSYSVGVPLVLEKYRQIVLKHVPQHLLSSTYLETAPAMLRDQAPLFREIRTSWV